MNNTIIELQEKVIWLEKLYNQMVISTGNEIDRFWMIFFGILTIFGVGFVYWAKQMTKAGIERGLIEIHEEYDEKLTIIEDAFLNESKNLKNIYETQLTQLTRKGVVKETGTWSPIIYGSIEFGNPEYELTEGRFYKIDNIVILQANIKLFNKNYIEGTLNIGGLPFVSKYTNVYGNVGRVEGFSNFNNEAYLVIEGLTSLSIYEKASNKRIKDQDIGDNLGIYGINIIYEI